MIALAKLRPILFVLLGALALVGAINPFPAPIVVVYPLVVGGGADPEIGANLAVLISTKLGEGGGVVVKPATPGTQRSKYLEAAKAIGADYYITGYVTPLGADTSLIAQVVSTYSGSMVYSTTAFVRTYGDAVAQADVLRQAILNHAGRALGNYDLPESYPSASAEPTKGESNQANLSRAFSHLKRGTPGPSPSPAVTPTTGLGEPRPQATGGNAAGVLSVAQQPNAPANLPTVGPTHPPTGRVARVPATPLPSPTPAPRWLIATVNGDAPDPERSYAATALIVALRASGIDAAYLPVNPADVPAQAAVLCKANPRTIRLYTATLDLVQGDAKKPAGLGLETVGYDCTGAVQARVSAALSASAANPNPAIDRIARQVAGALLRARPPAPASPRAG